MGCDLSIRQETDRVVLAADLAVGVVHLMETSTMGMREIRLTKICCHHSVVLPPAKVFYCDSIGDL